MNRLSSAFVSPSKLVATALLGLLLCACGGDKPEVMLASARDYLAKNDPKAAAIQLKNALQNNPELGEARYLLGLSLLKSGDPVGGETELRKALEFKHPPQQVIPPLAEALLAQGQYKKLTDEFSKTELGQPTANAEFQTSLAIAYDAQGKADLAKTALSAALAADPSYVPALLAQARYQGAARQFEAALASVDGILAKSPTNADAWKLKGDILLVGKNQQDEALAAFLKSVEVKKDFVAGHTAVVTLLMRQGKLDDATKQLEELKKIAANRPQTKYFETLLAYEKKDFKLARELSQQLLKMAPTAPLFLQLAGAVELQFNSPLQAEAYLAKAVQAAPQAEGARRMLVTTYLRSGQPVKAMTTLQPVLKDENTSAANNALAGQVYLQNGDVKKAEEYFSKAAKQDPKNSAARTSLALTHLAGGREAEGFGELQDIAAAEAGATADLAIISVALRRNEFDKALKAIDGLEKKQPDKPLASNLRGRTLLAKKDVAGARKSFERAVALDPLYFSAVASLAALDMGDKKPEEARKRFDAVLAKDPKNAQALLALAELRARSGGPKEEVAELIMRAVTANPTEKSPRLLLVELHLRNNDFKQALSVAQNAVSVIPDSPELLDALGRAQQASGDMNQALATYNKVATMQPLSPMPQMRLAQAYIAAKNPDAAAQSLHKALDVKPDLVSAQGELIKFAMDSKNFQEALNIAKVIEKQRPKEATGYQLEGDIAASQKKWDVAADAYRAGLKQVAAPVLALKLHAALSSAGKTAEVEKFTGGWLRDNPKDVSFRMYLGDVSLASKDYASAERQYLSVLQIQPDNVVILNNLAWITGKLGKDGAVAYAEKAIALAPNQPAFMDTLAMLLAEKNEYAKAVEWQNKALALQPQNGSLKLNLAKIHMKGGKKDLARKELDELSRLGDKFNGQSEVAGLLKSL